MRNLIKLFTVILCLCFLVACGGGGSSSGNTDETIASAAKSFTAEFPTFDDGGKNVIYAKTSIYYDYGSDYAKTVNTTLTEAKNFYSNCISDDYCENLPNYDPASKNLTSISSGFYFDGDTPDFNFKLQAERKISYSEFDEIFGSFTRFDDITWSWKYDTDMSVEFDIYRDKLIDSGLFTAADCDFSISDWHCLKSDDTYYFVSVSGGNTIEFEKDIAD
ncbi:MAG: hypothetical protein LBG21_00280 [Campylobacteraceae bacterium]|jgi:hypothetical protein|nr:hypothetical protein [Campylobacteraceae bacterium]